MISAAASRGKGMKKMAEIMRNFREKVTNIGNFKIEKTLDYSKGIEGLPSSDVLKYFVGENTITIRPSGTEPKIKVYYSISGASEKAANEFFEAVSSFIHSALN